MKHLQVPWFAPCGGSIYGDGNLVFIANDWHTALLPVYLKAYYRDNDLMQYTRSVLVIHNIAHQVFHLVLFCNFILRILSEPLMYLFSSDLLNGICILQVFLLFFNKGHTILNLVFR